MISKYWYSKTEIPDKIVKKLNKLLSKSNYEIIEINKFKLLKVNPKTFISVFNINRKYLFRGDYTSPAKENNYKNACNFLTEDGFCGFSISNDGWLMSLFSNNNKIKFLKAISSYVKTMANKLVCIVSSSLKNNKLIKLYNKYLEFNIVATTKNDYSLMLQYHGRKFIKTFNNHHGMLFHVFMAKTTDSKKYKIFDNYFEAKDYVNKFFK